MQVPHFTFCLLSFVAELKIFNGSSGLLSIKEHCLCRVGVTRVGVTRNCIDGWLAYGYNCSWMFKAYLSQCLVHSFNGYKLGFVSLSVTVWLYVGSLEYIIGNSCSLVIEYLVCAQWVAGSYPIKSMMVAGGMSDLVFLLGANSDDSLLYNVNIS